MSGELSADAELTWVTNLGNVREQAHAIVIMANGWLRVVWTDGRMTHVSPAAVVEVSGKGVSYGD